MTNENIDLSLPEKLPDKTPVYIYMRVSTPEQKIDLQLDALKTYCYTRNFAIIEAFTDKASGKNMERPGFQNMMKKLENNISGVKTIVVWKLDRLGRSQSDLIQLLDKITQMDITFISMTENIDTSTQNSRIMFSLTSILADYERSIILERVNSGIAAAKARNVVFGRPKKNVDIYKIRYDLAQKIPKKEIARKNGISVSTLYRIMEREEEREELDPQEIGKLIDNGNNVRDLAAKLGTTITKVYEAYTKYGKEKHRKVDEKNENIKNNGEKNER